MRTSTNSHYGAGPDRAGTRRLNGWAMKVMVKLTSTKRAPTVEEIERRFNLAPEEIDRQFGVVEIDDVNHEYTILVEESALSRIRSTEDWSISGPYSNPRIGPFGPTSSG